MVGTSEHFFLFTFSLRKNSHGFQKKQIHFALHEESEKFQAVHYSTPVSECFHPLKNFFLYTNMHNILISFIQKHVSCAATV